MRAREVECRRTSKGNDEDNNGSNSEGSYDDDRDEGLSDHLAKIRRLSDEKITMKQSFRPDVHGQEANFFIDDMGVSNCFDDLKVMIVC